MANTKFPLIINGVKFQVNPTSLSIAKPLLKGELATQSGIRYQIWYNAPEVLSIRGTSAGESAYKELIFLKQQFERTSTTAVSELYYKSKMYKGFIASLKVGHALSAHQRFPYEIEFQFLQGERFTIADFALEPRGVLGEAQSFLEENINAPIARFDGVMGQAFGKLL